MVAVSRRYANSYSNPSRCHDRLQTAHPGYSGSLANHDYRVDPPARFVDEQVQGPYRLWIHEHRFTEKEGGTLCEDMVQYFPWGGALTNKLFVERDVREIFAFRAMRLQELFGMNPGA